VSRPLNEKSDATDSFFRAFKADTGVDACDYAVCAFGDSAAMADELLELVLLGIKRATASLAREYGEGRDPLPRVGDYVVVVDGMGKPRCVWRTTEITVKPLNAVDEAFAFDEGEGDRTRTWWLDAHRAYFTRQAAREGFAMHDDIETVYERFTIVWPRLFADGPLTLPKLN
jgi:uncharacterized protein YhfF